MALQVRGDPMTTTALGQGDAVATRNELEADLSGFSQNARRHAEDAARSPKHAL